MSQNKEQPKTHGYIHTKPILHASDSLKSIHEKMMHVTGIKVLYYLILT